MSNEYVPSKFISALQKHIKSKSILACPYCGNTNFTSTDSLASILIGKDCNSISIGPSIPAGMLICQQCGHIDFFALGALGLLNIEDGADDGKQTK